MQRRRIAAATLACVHAIQALGTSPEGGGSEALLNELSCLVQVTAVAARLAPLIYVALTHCCNRHNVFLLLLVVNYRAFLFLVLLSMLVLPPHDPPPFQQGGIAGGGGGRFLKEVQALNSAGGGGSSAPLSLLRCIVGTAAADDSPTP